MRKIFTITAILLSAVMFSSCHRGEHLSKEEKAQRDSILALRPVEQREWISVDPLDLQMNPVKAFARDWMALAVGNNKAMNAMTISWGTIGELWGKPVVIVYVSSDRYSKALMDKNSYFTVSAFPESIKNREILSYIGSHSQAEEPDKVTNAGLKVEYSALGNPLFKQANLAIECKKLYSDEFKKTLMPDDVRHLYDELGVHTFYIGEIVNVFVKNSDGVDELIQKEEAQSDSQQQQHQGK